MRYTPDGTPVTNFSVATTRKWGSQDGTQSEETVWIRWGSQDGTQSEETVWIRITAWRQLAEVCNQYLTKGRQVLVEGRLTPDRETGGPRVYTRSDGTSGASYEVTALTVKFLGGRGEGEADSSVSLQEPPPAEMGEDEIPF
jgi:single-strand DNA-binding protein